MQGVTFDVDGTLYDSRPQYLRALPHLWRSLRTVAAFRRHFEGLRGERFDDLHAELIRRIAHEMRFEEVRVARAIEQSVYQDWPASFSPNTPLRGLTRLLDAIDSAGIPRAVISDHPSIPKLEAMGIGQGWSAIVDCSALGALKPLPDGLEAASSAMSIPPNNLIHIGDREDTDGLMAHTLGAGFLLRGKSWNSVDDLAHELGLDLTMHSS